MPSDTQDLVGFLSDRRPEVRKTAVDIVSGLTGSQEGINQLKDVQVQLLGALFRLIPDEATDVSKAALTALVNMSQDPDISKNLQQFNAVSRTMEYIREKSCPHIGLLLMLLVNTTVSEPGSEELLQLNKPGMEGLHMALLLQMFVKSAVTLVPGQPDPYEHIGALLTNTTRLEAGRKLLLQPGRGFLQALAAQLGPNSSAVRRRGCSGALRNCCISAEADGTLNELVADELVLARILAPLRPGSSSPQQQTAAAEGTTAAAAPAANGFSSSSSHSSTDLPAPAAPSQSAAAAAAAASSSRRDPDDTVREALAEAVAVLASTDIGRKALWRVSAPEVLQKAYEVEEHPGVCQAMEQAARSFMFDCDAKNLELDTEQQQQQCSIQEVTTVV